MVRIFPEALWQVARGPQGYKVVQYIAFRYRDLKEGIATESCKWLPKECNWGATSLYVHHWLMNRCITVPLCNLPESYDIVFILKNNSKSVLVPGHSKHRCMLCVWNYENALHMNIDVWNFVYHLCHIPEDKLWLLVLMEEDSVPSDNHCITPCTWHFSHMPLQGSTLRVNLWPHASKNSPKQLRDSKNIPQLVLQAQ